MKNLLFDLNPYSFTGSAIIIGLFLINELTPEEQNSIGNWLQLIGLTIQTYASQQALLVSKEEDKKNQDCNTNSDDLETLNKVIDKIKEELNYLKECQKNNF